MCFSYMLKKADNCENNEDISYDVESLFTNTPVKEIIEYVLKHSVKSLFSKNLLVKLTKERISPMSFYLIKQINDCPMGGPVSFFFWTFIYVKWKRTQEFLLSPFFTNVILMIQTYYAARKNGKIR